MTSKCSKVLYMSAYTDDSSIRQGELEPGADFIQAAPWFALPIGVPNSQVNA